MASFDIS